MRQSIRKQVNVVLWILIIMSIVSCEMIDPDETTPSYIHIEKIILNTSYSEHGTNSNKIVDAWVYIDDKLIGAFELPVTFPVLLDGIHEISIKPGIKQNGISSTRVAYPFFKKITLQNSELIKDEVLHLDTLTTSYLDNVEFAWLEDFEDGGISLEMTISSDTSIYKTSEPSEIFEGAYSGIVYMDNENSFFEIKTPEAFVLPKTGSPIFLELNYKTSNVFATGIFANEYTQSIQKEVMFITENDDWNKIYVNLTPTRNDYPNAIDFNIFFGSILGANSSTATVLFDNIKLVHFNN